MGLVLENGIWSLQADSSTPTLIDRSLTPSSGTPSSIADGATLDATLANGAVVHDPGGHFVGITDDGAKMTMEINTSDNAFNSTSWNLAPRITFPTALMGDVDIQARVQCSSTSGHMFIGVGSGNDATTNQSGIVGIRVGFSNAATAYAGGQGDIDVPTGTQGITQTSLSWYRFTIVGDTITWYYGGTGTTPSWSTWSTAVKWDRRRS